jgi:hypothetical protein
METSKTFKDIEAWKQAHEFVLSVYYITRLTTKQL